MREAQRIFWPCILLSSLFAVTLAQQPKQEVTSSEVEESVWANTVCTWSDELECYLDYLSVMPMSEIKAHYVKDEKCAAAVNRKDCFGSPDCIWSGACMAIITNATLEKCVGVKFPKAGTFCSILQLKNTCDEQDTPEKCAINSCEWDVDLKGCIPTEHSLMELEFLRNSDIIEEVKALEAMCVEKGDRVTCERAKSSKRNRR